MKLIELFSGIGGFAKGFQDAGFKIEKHYFSEIDKHAIANYKYNFPNAEYIGSVTDISGRDFKGIDIITFGSPCQDFSLAGKRKGLDGDRSSLISHAIRLVTDIRPNLFIWENVKGAFSSNNGADFWAILQAFANIGGYRLEWQLLNTKWFLPQNRERIYLVGHLATDKRDFKGVFPIGEETEMDNKWSAEKQIASCLQGAGGNVANGEYKGMNLICDSGKGRSLEKRDIMPPLRANTGAGHGNYIEVGTFRTHNDGKGFRKVSDGNCPTIPARARQDGSGQPVIVQRGRGNNKGNDFEICPTISANSFEHNNHVGNIRRLTEIECERLQGFSDNFTKFGNYDGKIKEIAKTQRYKMLGNAVTVKVVEEIAKRLKTIYEL